MRAIAVGFTAKNDTVPERGERVAQYIEDYLSAHQGLALGELAFRLKVDKRDLRRLLNDRSCGWRLEEALARYFGPCFVDHLFRHIYEAGPSVRELELARERASMAARRERLERDRAERRASRSSTPAVLRMVSDEDRQSHV